MNSNTHSDRIGIILVVVLFGFIFALGCSMIYLTKDIPPQDLCYLATSCH